MTHRDSPEQPTTYGVSLAHGLFQHLGKPRGWIGRLNLWRMNRSHSALTDWGLAHVSIQPDDTILDVGCGGGRTVAKLAALATAGKTFGVDYSDTSVAASTRTNQAAIRAGRVEIRCASVSQLPFPDGMFDLVTAVETHYYWPDLSADLVEIRRVLKPGGALLIVAEAYKGGKHDAMLQRVGTLQERGIMNFTLLTVAEHRDLLSASGYADVQVFEEYEKGWICAKRRRPAR